jgi:hypothetical protein
MPHKHNADRRHHIPKMSFKVRNWPAYEAGLRRGGQPCGSRTQRWNAGQTIGPCGQARYTNAAIQACVMLRTALKLALRQIEA